MMLNIVKRLQAKKYGVPFLLKEFWPPFYISFGVKDFEGCRVLTDVYRAKEGDNVPVLCGRGFTHYYTLLDSYSGGGDDHIVSPREFDLRYVGSEIYLNKSEDFESKIKSMNKGKLSILIDNWAARGIGSNRISYTIYSENDYICQGNNLSRTLDEALLRIEKEKKEAA